jgi:hypothetical protein
MILDGPKLFRAFYSYATLRMELHGFYYCQWGINGEVKRRKGVTNLRVKIIGATQKKISTFYFWNLGLLGW